MVKVQVAQEVTVEGQETNAELVEVILQRSSWGW